MPKISEVINFPDSIPIDNMHLVLLGMFKKLGEFYLPVIKTSIKYYYHSKKIYFLKFLKILFKIFFNREEFWINFKNDQGLQTAKDHSKARF